MEEMLMAGNANPNQNPNPPPPAPSAPGAQRAGAPAAGAAAAPSAGATGGPAGAGTERRARPQKEKALNCPRCNSTNTKFCYYNNYSLQQPRYFCKTCRRYWTEGGSLRNVPVGGGSRKNKRSSSAVSSAAAASTSAAMSGTVSVGLPAKNPKLMHEGAHDLNLAFPHHNGRALQPPEFPAFPSLESSSVCNPGAAGMVGNGAAGRGMGALSAMELLRSTGCYVPLQHVQLGMPAEYAAAGFALGEFRMPPPPQSHSVLGFSLDTHGTGGVGGAGGYSAGLQDSAAGRLLFPFEDLKPAVSAAAGGGGASNGADHHQYEHSKDQAAGDGGSGPSGVTGGHETPGFWSNSLIGNGSSNGGGGPW
ncbi:dof zinc finger protein DOF1.8 isoform X2 [Sorghum bicolor]|jgi:hypothetical protein|nr:dof zinc finger protein DOF1.8 isoform X2 [Sorghum bicolor]DAA34019.1 TPA_inf: Dof-type zinc finger protein 16 [Sorghum bicolor]|eukprot:XP_002452763.1 dof zinc finger protein DOF1.8 isoform X2 [Sorghum bicolor]